MPLIENVKKKKLYGGGVLSFKLIKIVKRSK